MDTLPLYPDTPAGAAAWLTATHRSRLARAGQRLKLAAQMIAAGAQFIPLGDNGRLLADLTARVHAARECGA
jgi:hypothetical protein